MAERWWNAPLGAQIPQEVVEGAADTSQFVAVRCRFDATGNSKELALLAIDAVRNAIIQDTWPPV
jgi:hypothetical protein